MYTICQHSIIDVDKLEMMAIMPIMKNWHLRLKQRMSALGLSQEALGSKLGKTRSAINHYVMGRRSPPLKEIEKMAHVLKCDPAWLQFGVVNQESKTLEKKRAASTELTGVPIIHWDEVAKSALRAVDKSTEFVPCIGHQQEFSRWFALRVKGDAMVAPTGRERSFHERDILIIDPDKEPTHGCYVIAIAPGTKEATFKQYVVDGGTKYLKPLNPQYPMVQMEKNVRISGVVITRVDVLN